MTIKVTREEINKIFKEANHQEEIVIGLYKLALPDWDNIKKVNGWPTINKSTNEHLFIKFREFDRKKHPNVIAGGLWLNMGFSSLDSNYLNDWEIDTSHLALTYQ